MAAHDLTVLEAVSAALEPDVRERWVPSELQSRSALGELTHEPGDLRAARLLTLPLEKHAVILPSIVRESIFPIHLKSRLERRYGRIVVAQAAQGQRCVVFHDDHGAVIECASVKLDRALCCLDGREEVAAKEVSREAQRARAFILIGVRQPECGLCPGGRKVMSAQNIGGWDSGR
jgi:hypothetical protein